MAILSKRTGKPASKIIGIKNNYEAYCVDETAEYVYDKFVEKSKNERELKEMMQKHSKRRGK